MASHRVLAAFCFGLPLLASGAWADSSRAEQAAEMLARAQSLDMKCSYLNAAQKDALSRLVARAELALANREPIEATKAAMQRGHAAGLEAACAPEEKQNLALILTAAQDAQSASQPAAEAKTAPAVTPAPLLAQPPAQIAEAPPEHETDLPKSEPQVATAEAASPPALPAGATVQKPALPLHAAASPAPHAPKPKKLKLAKAPVAPAPKVTKTAKAGSGLKDYARLAQAYYVARRCNSGDVSRLYQSVVSLHGQVMKGYSAREVSSALHGAEARAGSSSCT